MSTEGLHALALIGRACTLALTAKREPIDTLIETGKYKGISYRQLAVRDRRYAKWAATTIPKEFGYLCAEALALSLGVAA